MLTQNLTTATSDITQPVVVKIHISVSHEQPTHTSLQATGYVSWV
jgi:hypothetical protein